MASGRELEMVRVDEPTLVTFSELSEAILVGGRGEEEPLEMT